MGNDLFTDEDEAGPSGVLHPRTGELLPVTNIDDMIEALEWIKGHVARMYEAKRNIEEALIAAASSVHGSTRRVAGDSRVAKIEQGKLLWDNAKLKQVREDYPSLAEEFLRVSEVTVNKQKWDRFLRTAGPEHFEEFKKRVQAACKGRGPDTVTIER